MKKLIYVLVLMLMIVGCDTDNNDIEPSEPNDSAQLDFWTFWGSELRRPIIDQIINDYNEESDNEVVHTYNPYGDIWTKVLASISANNPPNVVVNEINQTALRGQKKRAEDLSEYIDDDFASKFFPELWDAMKYEDGIYGIPFTTDTRVLFYNKDHFREVGLDPDLAPATWDELIEYGNQLDIKTDGGFERLGFYPLYNVGSDVWMMNANGKNYLEDDGTPNINTSVNEEVMDWLVARREHYGKETVDRFQSQVDGEQSHPFLTQELSMVVATGTFYKQIKDYAQDFDLGVALIPEFKEGSGHTSWGGGFVMEIPYGADNKDEAWDFIKYLTDFHAQYLWGSLNFDNIAHIEAAEAIAKSEDFTAQEREVYNVLNESMNETLLTPMPTNMPNYYEIVNPVLEEIVLQRVGVKEGLDKIQNSLEELYNTGE